TGSQKVDTNRSRPFRCDRHLAAASLSVQKSRPPETDVRDAWRWRRFGQANVNLRRDLRNPLGQVAPKRCERPLCTWVRSGGWSVHGLAISSLAALMLTLVELGTGT